LDTCIPIFKNKKSNDFPGVVILGRKIASVYHFFLTHCMGEKLQNVEEELHWDCHFPGQTSYI
jgi:hypothetical protein